MNWKKRTKNYELKEPMPECYGFGTGLVNPLKKASRQAVDFISKQDGFKAVSVADAWHCIWVFDTLNNAKKARNNCEAEGIVCGNHIMRCRYDPPTLTVLDKAD